jgi:hypothetical protein
LLPVSSISSQPTQRVALPQASTSPPSRLWMRMKASAPLSERSMVIIWSKPIAVGLAEHRMASGGRCTGRSRASNTTNALPRPFILRKGIGAVMARVRKKRLDLPPIWRIGGDIARSGVIVPSFGRHPASLEGPVFRLRTNRASSPAGAVFGAGRSSHAVITVN